MFKIIIPATKTNTIRAGKLDLTLDDKLSNGIKLENAIPVSDADGMKETTYTFTLKNNGTLESNYTIYLDDESLSETQTRANDGFIRYNLVKNEEEPVSQLVSEIGTNPNRVLETDTIKAGETNTYKLNIWIDKDATNDVMGTVFYTKLRVETEQSHISQVDQCFSSKVIVKGTKEESKGVIESNGYSDENINLSGEINCAEKDNYDYSYKWYKNDEQIIGEETPNLNVSENGAYKLVVTVGEKEFSSNVFNVNIDKNTPSCTLAVIEGTLISDNKYSGDIKVKMTTSTAGSSGITFKGPTTSKTASYETEVKENEIGTNDFSITEEGTYELYGYVKNGTGKTSSCNLTVVKPSYTGIASKTYAEGETVTYGGKEWTVIKDNGDNTTLVLSSNYKTGKYGTSAAFTSGNSAYDSVNSEFVSSNETLKNDIDNNGVILDSNSNSYVRLPLKTELSEKIANNSNTNFWTMTPNGSSLYYGLPNGGYTYTSYYYSSNSGPYYNGYGTSTTSLTSRTLDTSVSSTSVSYPSASYSSTSAAYSYSPYQSNIGSYSDSYSNFTATNSATAPSKEYTHIFGTQSMYCSGSGTLINDSCLYSCTSGGGSNRTYTKAASNSTSNYCSNSGTSSFTYTLPEVSLLLNGYYQNEGTYYSPAEYTLAGAYNSVKNYYCKDIHSDQSVEYRQYYYCTSNCSGSSTGDTYYYATTSSCSDRWDYYVGEQTKAMGIRPVITIREK